MAVGDQVTSIADGDENRRICRERIRVYRNDWDDLLDAELSKQFVRETWERIKLMLDTSQNIFRRIVREICTVYKQPAVRELIVPSSESSSEPVEVPAYDALVQQTNLDWRMAEAHRLAKASWVCFLRPRIVPDTGEMRLDLITPDVAHVDLDQNDPLSIRGFGYLVQGRNKRGDAGEWWVYYTVEQIRYLDATGREVENPFSDDLDTTNPYGVIPVVPFFCASPTAEFWDLNWNKDAVRANYIIGVLNTYVNYLVKTQSFKQIAFTGQIGADVLSAISDPLYPLVLPEGATAATLDLNTQLMAIDSVVKGKVMAIANNYGISGENFNVTGSNMSGYALRISNRGLEEIRAADVVVASRTETELFNLMRLINNAEGGDDIPDGLKLRWNPSEIDYPPTPQEEQSRWEFEFRNGISNQVDYLIAKDPDLSREDAMVVLEQVKEESASLAPNKSVLETMFGEKEQTGPFGQKNVEGE